MSLRGGSSQTSMQVNNGHDFCYHMQSTMVSFVQWHTNVAPDAPLLMLSPYSEQFPRDQCITSRNWTGFHYYLEDNQGTVLVIQSNQLCETWTIQDHLLFLLAQVVIQWFQSRKSILDKLFLRRKCFYYPHLKSISR